MPFPIKRSHFLFLAICFLISSTESAVTEKRSAPLRLLILQPADLRSGFVSEELYLGLRKIFEFDSAWQVVTREKMEEKFFDYNIDTTKPCTELNCAFDAGSVVNAQYTLYSSFSIFQNYYIFSINLVSISATKVVWANNGEIPIKRGENSSEALLLRLEQIFNKLKLEDLKKSEAQPKGTLCILNLSPESDYSKILFKRLSTHAYTSGVYDLVDETELDFILASQKIQLSSMEPTRDNLLSIGKKLGTDYLIYSLLKKENDTFNLRLALFNINKKELVREWPYRSSDFRKLLKFESKFISKIAQQKVPILPSASAPKIPDWVWKRIVAPASLAAGGVFGYLSWAKHKKGNEKYQEWKKSVNTDIEAKRRPKLKEEVEQARYDRNLFGIISGVLISGTIVLITF